MGSSEFYDGASCISVWMAAVLLMSSIYASCLPSPHICAHPCVIYWSYIATGSTCTDVGQFITLWYGISETNLGVLMHSDAHCKRLWSNSLYDSKWPRAQSINFQNVARKQSPRKRKIKLTGISWRSGRSWACSVDSSDRTWAMLVITSSGPAIGHTYTGTALPINSWSCHRDCRDRSILWRYGEF